MNRSYFISKYVKKFDSIMPTTTDDKTRLLVRAHIESILGQIADELGIIV